MSPSTHADGSMCRKRKAGSDLTIAQAASQTTSFPTQGQSLWTYYETTNDLPVSNIEIPPEIYNVNLQLSENNVQGVTQKDFKHLTPALGIFDTTYHDIDIPIDHSQSIHTNTGDGGGSNLNDIQPLLDFDQFPIHDLNMATIEDAIITGVSNPDELNLSHSFAPNSHTWNQGPGPLFQPSISVRAAPKPNVSRKAMKLNSEGGPKEIVQRVKDMSFVKTEPKRKATQKTGPRCKNACLRCQLTRTRCVPYKVGCCKECSKFRTGVLLWSECVRPKFGTISAPEPSRLMKKKKIIFSGFVKNYILPSMRPSSLVNVDTATTYLKQWLAGRDISTEFTLASLLHTNFKKIVPAFGSDLELLVGFIVADNTGIDLRTDDLGKSEEEIDQLREHICDQVLFRVEREIHLAHTKIVRNAGRKTEGSSEITPNLLLLLLICGVAIGCVVECAVSSPAKREMQKSGDHLCEHLCRYLILAGRQLELIPTSTKEAALYKRWRQARILKTAIEHTSALQHDARGASDQVGTGQDVELAPAATIAHMTPSHAGFNNAAFFGTPPAETVPGLTDSSDVTPEAFTPDDVDAHMSITNHSESLVPYNQVEKEVPAQEPESSPLSLFWDEDYDIFMTVYGLYQ